jgi:hypothetical protein
MLYIATYCFLVTRECVPKSTLNKWRPSVSSNQDSIPIENVDIEDSSGDSDSERSLPFPLSYWQQPQHQRQHDGSEDEVQQDVISISGMQTTGIFL